MINVLIFQPYLSTRKLSSNTLERQFRFLKYRKDTKVYALFDISEKEYADTLQNTWITPLVVNITTNPTFKPKDLQKQYNFQALYIARTYFTPATKEHIENLKYFEWDAADDRYWRDLVPMLFAKLNVPVNQMIYDPLELKYDELIDSELYKKYSSMNNVEGAKCHNFADLGYYDKNKEVPVEDKIYDFTFGATAICSDYGRGEVIKSLYNSFHCLQKVNMFIRVDDIDTLVPNDKYEDLTRKSLFTYTIPSQNPQYVSFTRMLLALSQGTMPLVHPDNNLGCLFGEGFEYRDSLKDFFDKLIYSPEQLEHLLRASDSLKIETYKRLLDEWHQTEYYQWLQEQVFN